MALKSRANRVPKCQRSAVVYILHVPAVDLIPSFYGRYDRMGHTRTALDTERGLMVNYRPGISIAPFTASAIGTTSPGIATPGGVVTLPSTVNQTTR